MDSGDTEPLSQYFLNQLREMDKDSDEFTNRLNQELDEDERLGPMSDLISHYSDLIEVLEGFGQRDDSEQIMLWRSERGGLSALDRIFDEFFVRQFLSSIPGYVERLKRLSPMTSNKAPGQDINVYLRETTRCYILGPGMPRLRHHARRLKLQSSMR